MSWAACVSRRSPVRSRCWSFRGAPTWMRYRRELAGEEVSLGVGVTDFAGLLREMARRAGVGGRPLGERARERVAAVVAAEQAPRLRTLSAAAATDGFPRALTRLCAELSAARCDPRRFALAMTIWGRAERRERFAADLAALVGAYAGRLERLRARDPEEHAWAVLDALRLTPPAWGTTPVFLYGFDDLTDVQLDAVRTLADNVGARVVVSLPFEPRAAFAGRQRTWHELCEIAGHAARRAARRATSTTRHGLARRCTGWSAACSRTRRARADPGAAIELLEGGGPRAELELIAERVRRLHRRRHGTGGHRGRAA